MNASNWHLLSIQLPDCAEATSNYFKTYHLFPCLWWGLGMRYFGPMCVSLSLTDAGGVQPPAQSFFFLKTRRAVFS